MARALVSRALEEILGRFVDNFRAVDVRLAVWDGSLELHNLHLNPRLLQDLGLPLTVVSSSIGSCTVSVPWHSLGQKPIRISISDVKVR
jgi:vacuolar protein sorting-associated protein 13A/C